MQYKKWCKDNLNEKKLLIISDPISAESVQFRFLNNIIAKLSDRFLIDVYTTYVDAEVRNSVRGANLIGRQRRFLLYRLYKRMFGNNEGVLWAYSWILHFFFKFNSGEVARNCPNGVHDSILNIAQTIPVDCDIYWGQSVPLDHTLLGMRPTTPILRLLPNLFIKIIGRIDRKFIRSISMMGKIVVTNSYYTKSIYENLGVRVHSVVYSVPDLFSFKPVPTSNESKYVLAYIGKETEIDTVLDIARMGVRVVTFGAKIPTGSQIQELKRLTEFKGYVPKEVLISLYSNAIFTLFPFTHEPFGYVPLESISCGTPVLTYKKQGPSETVTEGVSGWLANNRTELINKAIQIWNSKQKMQIGEDVQNAARDFAKFGSNQEITALLITS